MLRPKCRDGAGRQAGASSVSCEQWELWDGEGFELCGRGKTRGRTGLWLVECALEEPWGHRCGLCSVFWG